MAFLILVRHGVTDWNVNGRGHGLTNIPLNEEGRKQAKEAAVALQGIKIDAAYTSVLDRVTQTFDEIAKELSLTIPLIKDPALNERDYGIYTGKNKWEVEKEVGPEEFNSIRRKWDKLIPGGESLKQVYGRVIPFFREKILEDLKSGKNVLIVSSGNSLRALIKYLKNISDEDISKLELNFGEIHIFEFDKDGNITGSQTKNSGLYKGKI